MEQNGAEQSRIEQNKKFSWKGVMMVTQSHCKILYVYFMCLPSLQVLNLITCTEHIKPLNFTVRAPFPHFWSGVSQNLHRLQKHLCLILDV